MVAQPFGVSTTPVNDRLLLNTILVTCFRSMSSIDFIRLVRLMC